MNLPELPPISLSALSIFLNEQVTHKIELRETDPFKDKKFVASYLNRLRYQPHKDVSSTRGVNRYIITGFENRFIAKIQIQPNEFNLIYNPDFFFYSHCHNGVMGIETILFNRGRRHYYFPHYNELFTKSLKYYAQQENSVIYYRAEWPPYIGNDVPSVNNITYRQSISGGMKPHEAAFQTPDGKILQKLGYRRFELSDAQDPYSRTTVIGYFSRR